MRETTVLLVEDNSLLRRWISTSLEAHGFRVMAPDSVTEALRLATIYPFDVVVTDWRLPNGYDGFEVLAHVRKNLPQVLSVLISADFDTQLAERARAAGFNTVLQKPFPPWKISDAIYSLLEASHVGAA